MLQAASTRSGTSKKRAVTAAQERYLIREAAPRDLDALYALSAHLDSVNFPHDRRVLKSQITTARASFDGRIEDPFKRQYMFVMEGASSGRLAGTSMIFAQHGHHDAPHIFFDVIDDERYSLTLNRFFKHTTLRLGFNYRGPTEIGALVLDPALRSRGLGKPLSFVRFLFIALYRERFRSSVIAELMPPLLPDGRSMLWEHLGRKFTGLDYREADKLSQTNKEFIVSLFPQIPLYATLLPPEVQALIGTVGEGTRAVKEMLEAIGFSYSHRIDPFDGGPHFEADTDRISLTRESRRGQLAKDTLDDDHELTVLGRVPVDGVSRGLVGTGRHDGTTRFRAAVAALRHEGDRVLLSREARQMLKLKTGDDIWSVPLTGSRR